MRIFKILIFISCIISTLNCAAKKYQIKVLNTPSITIDKKEARVGDWFDDQSVIVWSKDTQAMRVVSEDNKVYTLSAKLYKESKSKTFADFIVYTKPLAARGTNNPDLIEQLAERFDQDFIMLDEIVIDLSELVLPDGYYLQFHFDNGKPEGLIFEEVLCNDKIVIKRTNFFNIPTNKDGQILLSVWLCKNGTGRDVIITESFIIDLLPL